MAIWDNYWYEVHDFNAKEGELSHYSFLSLNDEQVMVEEIVSKEEVKDILYSNFENELPYVHGTREIEVSKVFDNLY